METERVHTEVCRIGCRIRVSFEFFTLFSERFGALSDVLSAAAYAFLSVALVEFLLLDSAIRRKATVDCVTCLDDFLLLDLVVVGTFEYLADFKQVLIEFFRVGFEIDFFLIRFRRHFLETLDLYRVFYDDLFFYFLRFFNLFFYLFFFDFGRNFRLLFFRLFLLLFLLLFGRRFGRNFLFRFLVFLRLHFLDVLVFVLVFLFVVEFLRVFVAVDFVLFKVHFANAQEVGKLFVFHIHIRLALVVQTLKNHSVESYHTVESLCAFVVDFVVLDFVGRRKACRLLIGFDKLPKSKCFFEVRLFQDDVRTHNRRTHGRGIAH